MNIAVILAGGKGSRFGSKTPKQFLRLAGRYIIEYTIEVFEKNKNIDEICIVSHRDYTEQFNEIVIKNNFKKVKKIISGGKERSDSSFNAIQAYKGIQCNLIFHDGVRPFITQKIINNTIEALKIYNAVDVAIPSADTIIEIDTNNIIKDIPKRANLRRGQTPQAFHRDTIEKAYKLFFQDKNKPPFTDDCGLVRHYLHEDIFVVEGDETNIKITYPADLLFAEKLIQLHSVKLEEESFDLQDKVLIVFGGSSGIGKDIVSIAQKSGAKVYSFSKTTGYDITDIANVQKAFDTVMQKEQKIDYIINTVGILKRKELIDLSYEEIDEFLDINLKSSIYIAKIAYQYLNEHTMILFFTSSSYTRGRSSYSLYSSTKAAIVNLTQALSEEFADKEIMVNCINPARTLTPMRIKNFGKEPEGSLLSSQEVAKRTLQVLSQKISGQIIDIKKGL